jgi:hypothetical protein
MDLSAPSLWRRNVDTPRGPSHEESMPRDDDRTRLMRIEDEHARIKKHWDDLWDESERMRVAYEESLHDGSSRVDRESLRQVYLQASDRWVDAVSGPPPPN